jgi:hypothetical protein
VGRFGAARLEVVPAGRKPIFVGVAAADAIKRNLSGTGYTTVSEHTGRGIVRTDHNGAAPATPPARTVDWTADAEGMPERRFLERRLAER